ncbi:hypothetical protein BU17DRAFT_88973 [Hysterangium stoloniferum]|nr:hypothetical protein BU17DRAFT_88973 [Hysterangium stoloniferum]
MEVYAASVDSTPSLSRHRVTRNISISRNLRGGGDNPQVFTPRLASFRHPSSRPEAQTTSDDDSGIGDYNAPNSRLLSASLPPSDSSIQSTDTTRRLKALLERFDANSRTPMASTHVTMPPTPSEPDYDCDSQPAQDARASIHSIFADALREPGDTPQKQRISRRASFNEIGSPKIGHSTRKGNSDEEKEPILRGHEDHSFSAADSLDNLRLHLTESLSGKDGSTLEPSSALFTSRQNAPSYFARQIKPPGCHSPLNHVKSHKDLEPFKLVEDSDNNSPYPESKMESNKALLDNFSTTQNDGARSTLRKSPSRTDEAVHEHLQSSHHGPGDGRDLRFSSSTQRTRRISENLRPSPPVNTGRTNPDEWPTLPPPGSIPSSITPRKDSSGASGHSGDGTSSPGTSVVSTAEYKDRLNEIEREHQHKLERNWNRPQQHHSHSTPHLHPHRQGSPPHGSGSGSSSGSRLHINTHSRPKLYGQPARSVSPILSTSSHLHSGDVHSLTKAERGRRPASALSVDSEARDGEIGHERHSSSSASTINAHLHSAARKHADVRPVSPASSAFGEGEAEAEELHERERNWNAPRPKFTHQHQHSHHHPHEAPSFHIRHTSKGKEPEHTLDTLDVLNNGRHRRSVSPSSSPRSKSPALETQTSSHQISRPYSLQLPVSSPMAPNSRAPSSSPFKPTSRSSQFSSVGRSGHSLSGSHLKGVENEAVPATTYPGDSITRHRRTMTELSVPTGPFPNRDAVMASAIHPDDSTGSLFANESVPPPQMSTPTFKATHLPDLTISPVPSDVPLPPSLSPSPPSPLSPNPDRRSRANVDIARLQRAVAPNFTFPPRHSSLSPSGSSDPHLVFPAPRVSPPARRSASRFKSPSPPAELPELPGRPSEDETEYNYTPMRPVLDNTLSALCTPRFPGAFGTPYKTLSSPASAAPLPSGDNETAVQNTMENSSPTYSTVTSNGATPAPPGAYQPTPAIKLKGIRKVRFDSDANDAQKGEEAPEGGSTPINGLISKVKGSSTPPSPSSDEVPININPTRNKALRLVDEFGRARRFTEDGEEIKLHRKGEATPASESPAVDDVTTTPRRRAKIRQVDEFGNELVSMAGSSSTATKQPEELSSSIPESKRKKAVLVQLARSLGDLKNDLAEEEDALAVFLPSEGQQDNRRLNDLVTVSDTARIERDKLNRKLELEQLAVSGKNFIARNPPRDSVAESGGKVTWWQRKWRLIIIVVIIELLLLLMGYRLANLHAKHSWLKTHFDPFFPALYLHPSRPNFLNRFKPVPMEWSAFAMSGAVHDGESIIMSVGKKLWEEVVGWRLEPW